MDTAVITGPRLAMAAAGSAAELAAGLATLPAAGAAGSTTIRVHTAPGTAARSAVHRGALLTGAPAQSGAEVVRTPEDGTTARPVVMAFPGLGDHHTGMGRDLYDELPVFRAEVDRCAELLATALGVDVREVLFPETGTTADRTAPTGGIDLRAMLGRGPAPAPDLGDTALDDTAVAQPALFVVEYALARQWQAWGVEPTLLIGYSLGEYVAACVAGVMSLEDALTLVAGRARLIAGLPAGAMLAVTASEAETVAMLGEQLSLAAVNGPELCVVAGPAAPLAALEAELGDRGVLTRRVRSSHAFHSTMMEPIAAEVTRLASTIRLHPPAVPVVSNVTGRPLTDEEATDPAYWSRHLCGTVRFADGLGAVDPGAVVLEVGPGQSLSSTAAPVRPAGTVVASMRHALDHRSDTGVLLLAMARLWCAGADLDTVRLPAAALDVDGLVRPDDEPPREPTGTERTLAAVWEKLLRVEDVTPASQFFHLGGNSMLATRLLLRISRAFDVELKLATVYERPRLADLAALIDETAGRGPGAADPAPVATTDARPPFTLPNGLRVRQQNEAETLHFFDDIFAHRTYAKNGISVPDGATVIDVGGNIGLFTLFAHYEARDVRVFTFEPAPPMFELLRRNVEEHGVNATLFHHGIAEREATASFTFYPHSSGMSSFHPDEAEEKHNLRAIIANTGAQLGTGLAEEIVEARFEAVPFTARLRSLSSVIAEQGIERIDLIKIDVQKSELAVIEGIADRDWPKIRQMVLEAHDGRTADGGRVALISRILRGRGFDVLVEQDELYVGTDIHNIYATRR